MYGCAALKRRGARLVRGEQGDREVVAWCVVEGQNECKSECPRMRWRDDAVQLRAMQRVSGAPRLVASAQASLSRFPRRSAITVLLYSVRSVSHC